MLIFIFLIIPIIELVVLFTLADYIGFWSTLIIIIESALIGVHLLKRQSLRTMINLQTKLQQGQLPGAEMIEGLFLFFAGGLLLTPGLLTDLIGLLILLPYTRQLIVSKLSPFILKRLSARTSVHTYYQQHRPRPENSEPIEGEFVDISHQAKVTTNKRDAE